MKILASNTFRLASRLSTRNQVAASTRRLYVRPALLTASLPSRIRNDDDSRSTTGTMRLVRAFSSNDNSDGSHDDFAPKRKSVGDVDEAVQMIEEHVKSNRVMLYMKGNPSMPMCGFSARVVQILQKEGVDFASVNVLDYPTVREGVKKYSDWPTIPQLYVDAEFVGGCDIITSMHESGELKELLKTTEE